MIQKFKLDSKGKLFAFFCLYIAQSIPMSFFSSAIPVLMRQYSFSLSTIALLQFMKLPWVLKFLWSPAVDRATVDLRDYRRFILISESVYAALILAVCFFNFQEQTYWIIGLVLASFFASATQDIATDALASRAFKYKDRGLVNGMQSMGTFVGTLLGSGVLLLLFNQLGWLGILPSLSLFVMLALIPLFVVRFKLPPREKHVKSASLRDLPSFFMQKGIGKQIGFLFLCYAGLIGTLAMLRPLLVDMGYSIAQVGLIAGVLGPFAGFLFSFIGGFIIRRFGRVWSRRTFAFFVFLTALSFYVHSMVGFPTVTLFISVAMLWSAYGISTVVVYTTSMDCVRVGREGTDFTLQTVLTHVSSMIIAVCSGRIADAFGYNGLFAFETVIALIALIYTFTVFKNEK